MKKRTAFILQVHKNPNQINTFIKQIIDNKYADIYIHIDQKYYSDISNRIIKGDNIFILKNSIKVSWGDISQVDATLLLLQEVYKSGVDYDFICYRSGQDLIVRNNFKNFLQANLDKVFMSYREINIKDSVASFQRLNWFKSMRKQHSTYHPFKIGRRLLIDLYGLGINLRPNKNSLPNNYSLYHGSSWFTIPMLVLNYIIEFLEENPWYYKAFENALCPDEWFFQTLILNSNYKNFVENDNLIYIEWGTTLENRNSPINLSEEHIANIESSTCFFARKFDESFNNKVIDHFVNNYKF